MVRYHEDRHHEAHAQDQALMDKSSSPLSLGVRVEQGLAARLALLIHQTLLPALTAQLAARPEAQRQILGELQRAQALGVTADTEEQWRGRALAQIASAWALAPLFLRILVDQRWLDRRDDPRLHDQPGGLFDERAALGSDQDQRLREVLGKVAALPAAAPIFGPENPLWRVPLGEEGSAALVQFFAATGLDGEALYSFLADDTQHRSRSDDKLEQVLPDLYESLAGEEREHQALIATPPLVARFLVKRTLDPALAACDAAQVRFLDPACGAGLLLTLALQQLVAAAQRSEQPGAQVSSALSRIGGLDASPQAVLLSRFRLLLAALRLSEIRVLRAAPALPLRVALADALLPAAEQAPLFPMGTQVAAELLGGSYEAIACEPPFDTPQDAALRERYRRYASARGEFSLVVPYSERCFQLAAPLGSVGLFVASSFIHREFGKALVEQVLAEVDLTLLVDSSMAFLPGHGTPTLLLFGQRRPPALAPVPVVSFLPIESGRLRKEQARRWSLLGQVADRVGFVDEFILVDSIERSALARHPFALGPALPVLRILAQQAQDLGSVCESLDLWDNQALRHVQPALARQAIVCPAVATEAPVPAMAVVAPLMARVPVLAHRLSPALRQGLLGYLCSSTAWCWLRLRAPTMAPGFFVLDPQTLNALPLPPLDEGSLPRWEALAAATAHFLFCASERPTLFPAAVLRTPYQTGRALKRALSQAQHREHQLFQELVHAQEEIDWLVYQLLGLYHEEAVFHPGRVLPRQRPFAWVSESPPELLAAELQERWTARRKALRMGGAHSPLRVLERPENKRPFGEHRVRAPQVEGRESAAGLSGEEVRAFDYPKQTLAACQAWLLARIDSALREHGGDAALPAVTAQLAAEAPVRAVLDVFSGRGADAPTEVLQALYHEQIPSPPSA